MKKLLALLAPLLSLALTDCVPLAGGPDQQWHGEDEEDLAEAYQAGTGGNPNTGINHFLGKDILGEEAREAYPKLADGPMVDENGYLPMVDIEDDARRQVLQNVVACALGVGQSARDPWDGTEYTGHWGLAMSWLDEPPTPEQQRWVTGCMIQRLNAWGYAVPILLEGNTSPITYFEEDDKEYPFDESTAWGNLFVPAGKVYVCAHEDLQMQCDAEGEAVNEWLQARICDGLADCGMVYKGYCENPSVCTASNPEAGVYPICFGDEGAAYKETVHVQVALSDATCTPAP